MSFRFQFRRGTAAERDAANPVLAAGEPAVVLDSGQPAELVLGDGVTEMADLRRAVWGDDARLAAAATATQPGDLGTAAAADAEDFATAEQGAKADTAVQPVAVAALSALSTRLSEASPRPVAIQILGDSTGNESTEWPAIVAQYLADQNPEYTVMSILWNDADQEYSTPDNIQIGTAGIQYATASSAAQRTRYMARGTFPHITGPMDIRVKLAADTWTTSAAILGREAGSGQRSWWCDLTPSGIPRFIVSTDGTNLTTLAHSTPVPFAAGETGWLRFVYNPDSGGSKTLQTYTSTDGHTWTPLGPLVTNAGVGVPFDANAGIDVGGRGGWASLLGKYYEVQVRDGVDGPNSVPNLIGSWPLKAAAAAGMQLTGAPVLTIVNGSHPGAGVAYFTIARLDKMTPDYGQAVAFLSISHNDGDLIGSAWLDPYDQIRSDVTIRLPAVAPVLLTQNPGNGATNQDTHAARREQLITYAAKHRLDLIDTFKAFTDDPRGIPALMADTVHPNAAGSQLWADTIAAAL